MKYQIKLLLVTFIGAIVMIPLSIGIMKKSKAKIEKSTIYSDSLKIEKIKLK